MNDRYRTALNAAIIHFESKSANAREKQAQAERMADVLREANDIPACKLRVRKAAYYSDLANQLEDKAAALQEIMDNPYVKIDLA